MKAYEAPCPSCAAPVRFKISSSLVSVCGFCQSVVARNDRKLEDRGKVAAIVETGSQLHLGLKGKAGGKSFEIVGHTQYQHAAGGRWNEWYAAFSNGKWGWLAEAQGRYYLTTARDLKEGEAFPDYATLVVGENTTGPDGESWVVAELGVAELAGAEGEIPYGFTPGATLKYADLYGPGKRFVTFDYSDDEPQAYVGREVTLTEIGITPRVIDESISIRGTSVSCPNCAGPLTLTVPDQAERVGCPNCGSLLDCKQGKLEFLKTLAKCPSDPLIPLGATGKLRDVEYTVIGFMQRSVIEEGTEYPWTEYLLYNAGIGFRWLVNSDAHWSFVEPVSPGDVTSGSKRRKFNGVDFKIYQSGLARVRYVLGEFYWKVEVGEEVVGTDFVAPPQMLSLERSTEMQPVDSEGNKQAVEVQYSLGTYIPGTDIEAAFGLKDLPRPWGVAPHQPNPVGKEMFLAWAAITGGLSVLHAILGSNGADTFFYVLSLILMSLIPFGAMLYYFGFESSRWQNSSYPDE